MGSKEAETEFKVSDKRLTSAEGILEWKRAMQGPTEALGDYRRRMQEVAIYLAECVCEHEKLRSERVLENERLRVTFELYVSVLPETLDGLAPKASKSVKDFQNVRYWKRYGALQFRDALRSAIDNKGESK